MQITIGGIEEAKRCALQSGRVALIHVNLEELEYITDGLRTIANEYDRGDEVYRRVYPKADAMAKLCEGAVADLTQEGKGEKKNVKREGIKLPPPKKNE